MVDLAHLARLVGQATHLTSAPAQECIQNCKCAPLDVDGLWNYNMSVKVPLLPGCSTARCRVQPCSAQYSALNSALLHPREGAYRLRFRGKCTVGMHISSAYCLLTRGIRQCLVLRQGHKGCVRPALRCTTSTTCKLTIQQSCASCG